MKKKNIEYCVYCGTKNKIEDKKCTKCNKKLNPKDRPLLEYLKSKIKDKIKGNLEDNFMNIITKYIKTHLYGFIMTCSIIITTTCIITSVVENNYIKKVTEKPLLVMSTINTCVFDNSLTPIKVCNEGYELEDNICKKEEEKEAISNMICQADYYKSGNSCLSNVTYDKLPKEECLLPNDGALSVSIAETGECLAEYCETWTDGECTAGGLREIDYTITGYYCPVGTSDIDGTCKSIANAITEYSCEEGTLSNDKCIITIEEKYYLSCTEGYILNEECNLCVMEEN